MDGLTRVYHVVCEALVYAPEEDICSEREKEAYADLANLVAISESTPGPYGNNMATYVGYA